MFISVLFLLLNYAQTLKVVITETELRAHIDTFLNEMYHQEIKLNMNETLDLYVGKVNLRDIVLTKPLVKNYSVELNDQSQSIKLDLSLSSMVLSSHLNVKSMGATLCDRKQGFLINLIEIKAEFQLSFDGFMISFKELIPTTVKIDRIEIINIDNNDFRIVVEILNKGIGLIKSFIIRVVEKQAVDRLMKSLTIKAINKQLEPPFHMFNIKIAKAQIASGSPSMIELIFTFANSHEECAISPEVCQMMMMQRRVEQLNADLKKVTSYINDSTYLEQTQNQEFLKLAELQKTVEQLQITLTQKITPQSDNK